MDQSNQARRLERSEFTAALKKGLGRAARHVSAYGLDEVADLVLEACLHDQRYDAQAEPNRAGWLFTMFSDSDQYPRFQESILNHLKTETRMYDALQLLGLAKEMAAGGDDEAFVQPTLGATKDHKEGVAAFREKRRPKFTGR